MKKILTFILIFTSFYIYSQDNEPGFTMLPQEDPEALFEIDIADTEVFLLLTGTWEIDTSIGFGLGFLENGKLTSSNAFSDMPQGFAFSQEPDLTLSLWIWDRFFIEAYFSESQTPSSYLVGYQGMDDEPLQYLAAGMSAMTIPEFPFQHFASGTVSAPGITGHVKLDNSDHHFILRYESAGTQEFLFTGSTEIEIKEIGIGDYIRGRFFALPDASVENLIVYMEDQEGAYTGSWQGKTLKFRQLAPDEAFISAESGRVYLNTASRSIIAVSYAKNGLSVGDSGLGTNFLPLINANGVYDPSSSDDFDFSKIDPTQAGSTTYNRLQADINGEQALILHIPGETLPFELPLFYGLEGRTSNSMPTAAIVLSGTEIQANQVSDSYFVHHDENTAQLVFSSSADYQNPGQRYPLYTLENNLYGPASADTKRYSIRERVQGGSDGIYLPEEFIPGSVQIYRNGTPTLNYTISGTSVSLTPSPAANEEIRIIVSIANESGLYGSLVAGMGSIFDLSDQAEDSPTHSVRTALGINWFIHDQKMAVPGENLSGNIRLSGSHEYQDSILSAKTAALLEFANPNTAGDLLLQDFDESEETLNSSNLTLRPGAAPRLSAAAGPNLSNASRGALFFKDYYQYSGFDTQGPIDINRTIPADQIYAYEDGSKPGPYVALKDNKTNMILDFEIDSSQEWVSGWLTRPGSNQSGITELSFDLDIMEIAGGSVDVYLLAGALDEDIDGDGILDAESSTYSTGFAFNTNGISLYPGAGPGMGPDFQISTEDINGNGILDSAGNMIVRQIAADVSTTEKSSISIHLNPLEQDAMHEFRGLAFVVVKNTQDTPATPLSGQLAVGNIQAKGSALHAATSSPNVQFGQSTISPTEFAAINGHNFDYAYLTSSNKAARISWDFPDLASKETIKAGISVPDSANTLYQGLSMLVKAEQILSDLTISFTDKLGNQRSWIINSLPAGEWLELHWKGPKPANLYLNDDTLINGSGELLRSDIVFAEITIEDKNPTAAGDGSYSGTVLIDELTARESRSFMSAKANSSIAYTPEFSLNIGETELIHDFYVEQDYQASADLPLSDNDSSSVDHSEYVATRTGFSLLGNELGGELIIDNKNTESLLIFGGHKWKVGLIPGYLTLSEDFFYTGPDFSHSHSADLSLLGQSLNYNSSISNALKKDHTYSLGLTAGTSPLLLDTNIKLAGSTSPLSFTESEYIQSLAIAYMLPDSFQQRSIDSNQKITLFNNTRLSNSFGLNNDNEKGQSISAETGIEQDFAMFDQKWQLFYRRKSSISVQDSNTKDFYEDFNVLFSALPDHYLIAPVSDFIEIPDSRNMQLTPEAGFSMSRKYGSDLSDLYIPSKLSYSFEADLNRQNNAESTKYTHTFAASFYAINLLGKYGTIPLLSFYETDDISWGISGSIAENTPSLNHFIGYHAYKGDKEIFNFDTSIDVKSGSNGIIKINGEYTFDFYWYPDWKAFHEDGEFINSELLSIIHENPLNGNEGSSSFSVKAGHSTKYRIPGMGYVEASLKTGLQFNESGVYSNTLLSLHGVLQF